MGRDGDAETGTKLREGRDDGRRDRDNGEGNLETRGEGERYRQMEGKSRIVTWAGQRQKYELVCNSWKLKNGQRGSNKGQVAV